MKTCYKQDLFFIEKAFLKLLKIFLFQGCVKLQEIQTDHL